MGTDGASFQSGVWLLIIGGLLGFFFSIAKDILWSGLRKIFPDGSEQNLDQQHSVSDCKDCLCLDRIIKSEVCMQTLKKDSVSMGKDIEFIKERAEKNDDKIEALGQHIQSIDLSLKEIVTVVRERLKESHRIF